MNPIIEKHDTFLAAARIGRGGVWLVGLHHWISALEFSSGKIYNAHEWRKGLTLSIAEEILQADLATIAGQIRSALGTRKELLPRQQTALESVLYSSPPGMLASQAGEELLKALTGATRDNRVPVSIRKLIRVGRRTYPIFLSRRADEAYYWTHGELPNGPDSEYDADASAGRVA